uniref:Uncharacterized protein n=1 Tax=Compsopogon caeruleus TaxID=31354 RepID=A0A7S1TET3_9RHOD|mmetsp:Transcript_3691/g.7066  ORF Transcript_3691/g.7066 Transcript_3691/m.7066 type:complete len:492 (+) Transcript_3691:287-1762(+)
MKGGRARGRRVERDDDEDVEGGWSGQEESHVSVEHRVVGKVSSGSRVDESSDSDQGRRWNGRGRRTPSLTLSERWIPKRIERRVSKSPNMSPGNRRYRERSPILSWIFGKKPSPGIRNVRKARGKGRGRRIRKDKTEWLRNSVRNSIRFWEKVAPKTFQARAALVLVSLFTLYVVDFYKITEEILQDRVVKVQRSNAFEVDSKKLLQNSLPFSSSQRSGGPSIILPGPSRNETISKGLNATVKEKPGEQSSRKPATTKEREKTRNDDDERGKSQSTGVTVEPGLTPGSSKNSSESESKDTSIVADNSKSTDVGQAAVLGNDLGSKAKNPSENAHEISRESVFEPKSKPSKSGDMQSENGSSASDGDIEANSSSRSVASTGGDFSGESPFNRQREDLAVPGGLGELSSEEVKRWYTRLALAYLKPFQSGISRKAMLGILRRRNYALTPPGASKGVQSMLFQIKNNSTCPVSEGKKQRTQCPTHRNNFFPKIS